MGAYNAESKKTVFFALKAKTSDTDPTPFFGRVTKVNDQWVVTDKFNAISGRLVKIEHSTYEFEQQTKHKVQLHLMDADGTENILGANFSYIVYSLLNSLAACEDPLPVPENIDLRVYLGKAKVVDGKAGKQYPGISIKNNGLEIKWKWQWDNQPHPEVVEFKGKKIVDDENVINFWKNVIDNVIKPKLKSPEPQPEQAAESNPVFDGGAGKDDMPF